MTIRLLVTGATGFIGRRIAPLATAQGCEVLGIGRRSPPDSPSTHAFQHIDLSEHGQVRSLVSRFRPDAVMHLAWYADPRSYLDHPANIACVTDTLELFEAALSAGCRRFLMAGTCAEYRTSDRDLCESDPLEPRTLYAGCKLAAWAACRDRASKAGAQLAWARIFGLYGPDEQAGRLLPDLRAAIASGRTFEATDGRQLRDLLHVNDAASAFVHLIKHQYDGPINICSGRSLRMANVMLAVARSAGREDLLRLGARPRRNWDPDRITGNAATLLGLGWMPKTTLADPLFLNCVVTDAR